MVVLLLALTGCSAFANFEVGYAHAIAKNPEQAAVAINTNVGIGKGISDTAGAGAGPMLRMKFGPNVQQVALGSFAFLGATFGDSSEGPISLVALGGIHLLQVENVRTTENNFCFGMGSPVVEMVLAVRPARMTFAVAGEYDVRFNSIPNTGYVSFLVGVGGFVTSRGGMN